MDATDRVEQFVRTIRSRNRIEIIACLLPMILFGYFVVFVPLPSLMFWGLIALILGVVLMVCMVAFVASLRGDLTEHPADDIRHWRGEMLRQARLLRLAPLWYISPGIPGAVLVFWCASTWPYTLCAVLGGAIAASLGFVAWLNLRAAANLQQQADSLEQEQANWPDTGDPAERDA